MDTCAAAAAAAAATYIDELLSWSSAVAMVVGFALDALRLSIEALAGGDLSEDASSRKHHRGLEPRCEIRGCKRGVPTKRNKLAWWT